MAGPIQALVTQGFFCSYVIVFNASGVNPSHNLLVIAG